jgi:hypothetical protein
VYCKSVSATIFGIGDPFGVPLFYRLKKLKLSLRLTEYRAWRCIHCSIKNLARKTYWGTGGLDPRVFNLGTVRWWVVSFTPRPLYPRGKEGANETELIPWSRVLVEKLTVTQLVKIFPTFYGTRRFIIVFTRARHWSLSWARWIQSAPSHHISLRFILRGQFERFVDWRQCAAVMQRETVTVTPSCSGGNVVVAWSSSKRRYSMSYSRFKRTLFRMAEQRGLFEKFVDSPYYSESELCGDAATVSFSKYLPWQAMHFLQRSTHFSKT